MRGFLVAVLAALVAAAPAAARLADDTRKRPQPPHGADAISVGLRNAVFAGRLTVEEAARFAVVARRARAVLALLPEPRRAQLAAALELVALQNGAYTRERSQALFGTLDANAHYFAVHEVPPTGTDVIDADGVLYRAGWGYGLQFHPLGNFGRLNRQVSARRDGRAARLAAALLARAVAREGGSVWEYGFPFGTGGSGWTSGMAQAVAAQALARAGTATGDRRLVAAAARAYRAIRPRLVMQVSTGPWIRHYDFSDLVVLNAQLQAVISLANYAALTRDEGGRKLARELERSAAAMLPRFDTGYWSLYSPGREAPLKYHVYVVALLRALAARTGDEVWISAAERFGRYTREPPIVRTRKAVRVRARPGGAPAKVSFWLSKPSTVALAVAGTRLQAYFSAGLRSITWNASPLRPGRYSASLRAVDLAGNHSTVRVPVIVEHGAPPARAASDRREPREDARGSRSARPRDPPVTAVASSAD